LALLAGTGAAAVALAQNGAPFGAQEDVQEAEQLWQALVEARLVSDERIRTMPYEGVEPHGLILEYFEQTLQVGEREGIVIVKTNYMLEGEQLTREDVLRAPEESLDAYTVMFQREQGYHPDHQDWFWVKYDPDGSLDTTPDDVQMAGRVVGCIDCHTAAPGDDYVFSYEFGQR
jgi:hypothetical protein